MLLAAAVLPALQATCLEGEGDKPSAAEKSLEKAEVKEDKDYQDKLAKIARAAGESVRKTNRLFIIEVAKLFTNDRPYGKGTLKNVSGVVQGSYIALDGGYPTPNRGIQCANRLAMKLNCTTWVSEPTVTEADAKARCNEVGFKCSGYSCFETGTTRCFPCSGFDELTVNGTNFKPFFAKKHPDQLQFDSIVNKSKAWVKMFDSMQIVSQDALQAEQRSVEDEFKAQERRIELYGKETMGGWRKREEEAWRKEEYKEASWYANKMKLEISKIDAWHNQILNKLVDDINRLNNATALARAGGSLVQLSVGPRELAKHNSAFDCWAAVDGKVYDFSPWTGNHPNAQQSMVKNCGQDITDIWRNFHGISAMPSREFFKGPLEGAQALVEGEEAEEASAAQEASDGEDEEGAVDYEPLPEMAAGSQVEGEEEFPAEDLPEEPEDQDQEQPAGMLAEIVPHSFRSSVESGRLMRRVAK